MTGKIAFQGALGAYSHEACAKARPDFEPLPCPSFEDVIAATNSGEADLAMLPVENSTYGRVADIHRLLPASGLHIVDEAFVRVKICVMAATGVTLSDLKSVRAHLVLIPQCQHFLTKHNIAAQPSADSAGAAMELAQSKPKDIGALASEMAAHTYGLDVIAHGIEDNSNNTTRFLIMAREADMSRRGDTHMITSFIFRVRHLPAALYKAMGGFATNGVNMTKLESYMVDGEFTATQFYADIAGHPDDPEVQRALEELKYFTSKLSILGTYPAAFRRD